MTRLEMRQDTPMATQTRNLTSQREEFAAMYAELERRDKDEGEDDAWDGNDAEIAYLREMVDLAHTALGIAAASNEGAQERTRADRHPRPDAGDAAPAPKPRGSTP